MRITVSLFSIGLLMGLALSSCGINITRTSKSKNLKEYSLDITDFSGIAATGSIDIHFRQAQTTSVTLICDPEIRPYIEVTSQNNTLISRLKKRNRIISSPITLVVTAPSLSYISNNGSGDITLSDSLTLPELQILSNGSGDLSFKYIKADNQIEILTNGSGDIDGKSLVTGNFSISSTGSGDIELFSVVCDNAEVTLVGSGDCQISDLNCMKIAASAGGSGDITLAGKALYTDFTTSGSASIKTKGLSILQ